METTVTNLPQHKGAFTESMCGGVIYYTPDITNPNPVWREVFDDIAAAEAGNPNLPNDGGEPDCPSLVDVLVFNDTTSGGPHWGALDNFALGSDGYHETTTDVRRISVANYFVARAGIDGNHKVYIVDVDADVR